MNPMKPKGAGLANRRRKSPTVGVFGWKYNYLLVVAVTKPSPFQIVPEK